MPVQTRAAAQPQPAKAVQKPAAPELKQLHFPTRRRQVTKTYGRRAAPKRPDQTLTQMDFVSAPAQEDLQLLISSDDDDDDDDEEKENEETAGAANVPKKPAVKKKATRKTSARSNRRRTTGNVAQDDEKLEKPRNNKRRKTMGDPPSASSSFHTQTLTQFLSSTSKDEDVWKIPDSEDEDAVNLDLVKETPRKRKSEEVSDEVEVISAPKPVATTPANRQKKAEIPSSQSPATPLLLRDSPQKAPSPLKHPDTPDCLRYNPEKEPSPLKQKSDKMSPSVSVQKLVTKTPRTLVIQDSYSTTHSSPITPTPKAKAKGILLPSDTVTPAKRIRFELPEDKENVTPGRTKPKSPKPVEVRTSQRQPLSEVPDSDDELEEETETDEDGGIDATSTAVSESTFEIREDVNEVVITADGNEDDFAAGAETQALLISSDHPVDHETLNSTPIVAEDEGSVDQEEDSENAKPRNTTPSAQDFVDDIIEQTPSRTPRARLGEPERTEHEEEFTQGYTQGYTQGMESQRVPLETIKATGPITDRSDIIISIYCEHVENMTKRSKTHEFRDWKIPETVHRVWIYVPRPISELRYMCTLGPAKTAGQIHEDGLGNAEFNQGMMKRSKFAFEVLSMYELNNPVSNQVMQQNGWPRAPQKFSYVPPAVVGQLTSNLRCALWGEDEDAEQDMIQSSLNVTESQELAHQIRSDIDHATQLESSDQAEVIPSSQSPPRVAHNRGNRRGSSVFARPALPKTATASSARSLPASQSQRNRRETRPSQATTISQMSSSPHVSPGKSVPLPPMAGAQRTAPAQSHATSSPVAHEHSLRSSQFPTKSQMLPDSLVNGDIQEPPQIIWDSEDESD